MHLLHFPFLLIVWQSFVLAKMCGRNEEWLRCGTACEPFCGLPTPAFCDSTCKPNVCQCKLGFKRGPRGCVLDRECPGGGERECDDPMTQRYERGVHPSCQLTCDDVRRNVWWKPCRRPTTFNVCLCMSGYVLESEGGYCVPRSKCFRRTVR